MCEVSFGAAVLISIGAIAVLAGLMFGITFLCISIADRRAAK